MKAEFLIPLRTKTGLNQREHWSARRRRVEAEKHATSWGFVTVAPFLKSTTPPYLVTLTRIGPRYADRPGGTLRRSAS